jgi:hypothetical protein
MDLPAARAGLKPVSGHIAQDRCIRMPGVLRTGDRCRVVTGRRRPAVPAALSKQAPPGGAWPARPRQRHEVHVGPRPARPGRCVAEVAL